MPNLVLIYSISKIGCFFSGCCKGVLLSNGKNLPIQLIESIINFVIYIIIIKNYKNFKNSYQKIGFTCMFFTFFKFILEFFRYSNLYEILSISQLMCIVVFIFGIAFMIYGKT